MQVAEGFFFFFLKLLSLISVLLYGANCVFAAPGVDSHSDYPPYVECASSNGPLSLRLEGEIPARVHASRSMTQCVDTVFDAAMPAMARADERPDSQPNCMRAHLGPSG